jgi:hypothetical protein
MQQFGSNLKKIPEGNLIAGFNRTGFGIASLEEVLRRKNKYSDSGLFQEGQVSEIT